VSVSPTPPGAQTTAKLFQEDEEAYLTHSSLWGTQQNSPS